MKIILCIVIMLMLAGYLYSQECKFCIDNERAGLMLLRGGYRAWWIRYSEGTMWGGTNIKHKTKQEGDIVTHYDFEPKNLWCFPRFEHCDVRQITGGSL